MHNDRIPRRPLLGDKYLFHRSAFQSVRAQSIDGFCWKSDQTPGAQNPGRPAERLLPFRRIKVVGIDGQAQGLHAPIVAFRAVPKPPAVYSLLTMPVETEVKFRVDDLAGLSRQLEAAGFTMQTPRSFESNVLYDTPDRQMRARTEILRLRSYAGLWVLTHKRLPDSGPGEDTHKHRIETETVVSDGDALTQVFRSLGLVPAFRYEKWRAEWQDGEGHCVVDETPIGNFAELEGPDDWIDSSAARLGVEPSQYITLSYGRLFDQWRLEHGSAAEDLTFASVGSAGLHR